ncbi:MAG: hypothetical protein H6735_05070 [Alphaproteobacteria bacterium]|nr:hypothetical protein [Alphaproteobacteria bacterium]
MVTVEFEAVAAGRHPFFLTAWRGDAGASEHHRFAAVLSVQMDPTLFCQRNLLATQLATLKYVALQAAAGRIGAAWEIAWERHSKTLEAAEKAQQLVAELLFGAFVTGLSAGAGTAAALAFKNAQASAYLIDGAKDLAKFGVKSAVPKPKSGGLPAVAMDPVTFRASIEDRVGQEMVSVLELLAWWTEAATAGDPDFLLDFDPAEVVQGLLTLSGQPLEAAAPGLCADIAGGADEFERGMWAEWLEAYAYSLELNLSGPDLLTERWFAQSEVNWPIMKRLEVLLPDEARSFLAQHAAVARERVQGEAGELNGGRYE